MGRITLPVIVLAGGRGHRLRSVVNDVPKPMAPVGGRPFLEWLISDILAQGAQRILLSIGYKHEVITKFAEARGYAGRVECHIEASPMGTGGAVRAIMKSQRINRTLVVNGDTMFAIALGAIQERFETTAVDVVVAVRRVDDVSRYGALDSDSEGRIRAFREKGTKGAGFINGGIYALHVRSFDGIADGPFSLEQEVLERGIGRLSVVAAECEGYFVDIGVPEDYARACRELPLLPRFERISGSGQ